MRSLKTHAENGEPVSERVRVPMEEQICLAHNPKDGKKCSNGKTCPRVHLDTHSETKMKTYKEAEAAIARVRSLAKNKKW